MTVGTDLQSGGYNYTSTTAVRYDVPVAPAPSGVYQAVVQRVHQSMPAPTLINGRPT